ncbi:MAG TPA: hypothetical protein VFA37_02340 [Gaiellaceae bacterium]|nr:hypothetical protein [Gaiellaceae bacterium]
MAVSRLRPWRLALSVLAAVVVFAGVYAFAASAGVRAGDFGANARIVASCGSGMTFTYTTAFDSGISGYAVDGIDVSRIPAGCRGEQLSVNFYDDGDEVGGSPLTVSLPASGTTEEIPVDPGTHTIAVSRVSGVSVVVS